MKLLHICNDFAYSKVHVNLHKVLDKQGIQQIIFHPLRTVSNKGKNIPDFKTLGSEVIYSQQLKKSHRIFFRNKIRFLQKSLKDQVELNTFSMQFATTLFSDGALAYKNFKEYKIPYTVAVRSTDVEIFIKLRPDLYFLGGRILMNASQIIFITPSLKEKLFSHFYFKKFKKLLEDKIHILPNAVDNYWIQNSFFRNVPSTSRNILYVGRFSKYKNILSLINAVELCRKKDKEIVLNLVGGDGDQNDEVISLCNKHDWINYHGMVSDKEELKKIYRENDFYAMPSFETFGLSFIEALTQGLPILYSKGYGVDGILKEDIGIATNPGSINEISSDLNALIENREFYSSNIKLINFEEFSWDEIGKKFMNIITE